MNDTIVAVSSAPGTGQLGIVRLTGPASLDLVDRMARVEPDALPSSCPTATRVAGLITLDDEIEVPAVLYIFRAPRSYTTQNMIEIHTVGSPALIELVRLRAIGLGALPAQPGEFTARAFLNGAMDLAAAEAVAATINAQSDTQLRASRRMMDGTLGRRIEALRTTLASLLALVEADIDFSEEPIEFITPEALVQRLEAISDSMKPMLASNAATPLIDALPRILLLGPPNAGKSTLMNRLSGTDRAICAAGAGTTRDVLSATIRLTRGDAILLDSAGVDRSDGQIISTARQRALATAEQVDLVCVVIDATQGGGMDDSFWAKIAAVPLSGVVVAANKIDLVPVGDHQGIEQRLQRHSPGTVCLTSATTGAGVSALRAALSDALAEAQGTTFGETVVLNERQRSAVVHAAGALRRATDLAAGVSETIDCAELLAFELRDALDTLGTVAGAVTTEDLLAEVFANFCIGK